MKKLIYLDDRARKFVISVIVLAFAGVIAMGMFMGCTGEEVDRAKDTTGRIIDIIDKVDEIEREIEDIIDEEAPKESDSSVSGVMMNNPMPQGGIIPPSSPNRLRGIGNNANIVAVSNIIPQDIPIIITEPILIPGDILSDFIPINSKKFFDNVMPRKGPHVRTLHIDPLHQDYIPVIYLGDMEQITILPTHDTAPGCLFEDACWNGCA